MSYRSEKVGRLFQLFCSLPERELKRPGLTVNFSALVNLSQICEARGRAGAAEQRISYTSYLVKALALTLKEFPYANRRIYPRPFLFFLGKKLVRFNNLDIAVAAERDIPGVESAAFVDICRSADRLSLVEIRDWCRNLAESTEQTNVQLRNLMGLARTFPIWLAVSLMTAACWIPGWWVKYRGAAALISSPGKYGVEKIIGMWAWPLGVSYGQVKDRAVVIDGEMKIVPSFYLTMNFDRRVMAGGPAARFFNHLVQLLEHPEHLEHCQHGAS